MKSQDRQRYPIGRFEYGKSYSIDEIRRNIKAIAQLPKELKKALKKLKSGQLDVPYRKGGWTPRQVVHHLADSHMNAYVRMKLAVTEQAPIIKPYEEADWAETDDSKHAPVKLSLKILTPLHRRWVMFLESLPDEALERGYFHPEMQRIIPLPEAIALYAWHGKHHVAHIRMVSKGKALSEESSTLEPAIISAAPAPKKRGRRAGAARASAASGERKKPGPKPKAASGEAPATGRRKRRTKAEMETSRSQPAAEKASTGAATRRRGMSPEHMAKIREARMAKRAAAAVTTTPAPAVAPATTRRKRRTKAEMDASRTQAAEAAPAERKKPGRKPKAVVEAAAAEQKKPGRKPKAVVATEPAERKKPGRKPKAVAEAGSAEPPK